MTGGMRVPAYSLPVVRSSTRPERTSTLRRLPSSICRSGTSMTGSPTLMALRKKMRANERATTQETGQLAGVERLRVLAGDYAVGVDVVAHQVGAALVAGDGSAHASALPPAAPATGSKKRAGSVTSPVRAEAATTAGEER